MFKFFKEFFTFKKNNIVGFNKKSFLNINSDILDKLSASGLTFDAFMATQGMFEIEFGLRKFDSRFDVFNEQLYLHYYPDVKSAIESKNYLNGFEHFQKHGYDEIIRGKRTWKEKSHKVNLDLQSNINQIKFKEEFKLIQKNLDLKFYREKYIYTKTYSDEYTALHYYLKGWRAENVPNEWFDSEFYLETYGTQFDKKFNPFMHFLQRSDFVLAKANRYFSISDYIKYDIHNRAYLILEKSEFFDVNYYLEQYNDVKSAGIDPIQHYLFYGYKEFRNPSALFDTNYYLNSNPDIAELGINPLVHYIEYGKREKREPLPLELRGGYEASKFLQLHESEHIAIRNSSKKVDILIPVYNGIEYLEALFKSIKVNSDLPYRLLICDDKSPDKNVLPFLKKILENNFSDNYILMENSSNIGFVKTVNKLVGQTKSHFVILNTDTEVPKDWLSRLMRPILEFDNIATTTPFTNAGTICSFPNYLEDNEKTLYGLSVNQIDSYFKMINMRCSYIEIPTGVGFCMGVNLNLVKKIGMFDEVFGKGYGEENDFCQRAIQSGYKNLHVTNLFVYHKHGGSFPSETKRKLIERNLKILNKKHTTYDKQVQEIVNKDELKYIRDFILFEITSHKFRTVLLIDHNLGGGAVQYRQQKVDSLKENNLIILITYEYMFNKNYVINFIFESKNFKIKCNRLEELFAILNFFKIDEIFLNSLVSFPELQLFIDQLLASKVHQKSKLVVPIHDFFPLCPSYTLLNEKNEYCSIPEDSKVCDYCLASNINGEYKAYTKETDIIKWRSMWNSVFKHSDEILCFSNSSKEIFAKVFPKSLAKVIVKPHDISGRFQNIYEPTESNEIRIGVLGGINIAKGAYVIEKLINFIDNNHINAKVILIGDIAIDIKSNAFEKTGRYNKDELESIVKEKNITKFFIPSIWPETFSYTTDEIMQMGFPLVVFDIGAPAERVKKYKKGKVIKQNEDVQVLQD